MPRTSPRSDGSRGRGRDALGALGGRGVHLGRGAGREGHGRRLGWLVAAPEEALDAAAPAQLPRFGLLSDDDGGHGVRLGFGQRHVIG